MAHEAISFPFMNILGYADGVTFGVDFYHDVDAADYEEQFAAGWREVIRGAPLRPRAHPFFFVVCARCSTPILTNRRLRAALTCRVCSTPLEAVESPSLALRDLRDRALEGIGKRVVDISGQLQVVLIQPVEAADLPAVEEECAANGFERTPEESPAYALLGSDSVKRGFDTVAPLSAWQKTAGDGQLALEGETTPDVDDLVGVVNTVAAVRSLSATFDLSDQSELGLLLRGDYAELERRARDGLARDPGSASGLAALVEVLVARGTLDEAVEKARMLTALHDNAESWRTLGRIEIQAEHWPDAATAFERALELDPLAGNAMIMLAHCYSELGDEGKAQLLRARATALGF